MIDGVLGRILQRVLNVVVGKMKVAARVDPDYPGRGGAQLVQFGGYDFRVELELVIGVRAGDDVGRAAFGRQAQHFERLFERLGAIIQAWQDVAMHIDQVQINISSSCVAWSTDARFPRARAEMAARKPLTTPFT